MPGYVHVYTGDGKGKTTAALGMALRAAGAGWNVFLAQFAKGGGSSELSALTRHGDRITVRQYTRPADIAPGLAQCKEALASGRYQMVILDEANLGPMLRLFQLDDLLELIDARSEDVELLITGRDAHPLVVERADLVTEMREVKHYYRRGVPARCGVEQ